MVVWVAYGKAGKAMICWLTSNLLIPLVETMPMRTLGEHHQTSHMGTYHPHWSTNRFSNLVIVSAQWWAHRPFLRSLGSLAPFIADLTLADSVWNFLCTITPFFSGVSGAEVSNLVVKSVVAWILALNYYFLQQYHILIFWFELLGFSEWFWSMG